MGLGVSSLIDVVMYGQEGLRKGLSESTRVGVKRRMAVFQTRGASSSGGGPVCSRRFSYLDHPLSAEHYQI
jgi:hypothetical protein